MHLKPRSSLEEAYDLQRRSFDQDASPSAEIRKDRLIRLAQLILDNEAQIIETVSSDFQGRSTVLTKAADVLGGAGAVAFTHSKIAEWMAPSTLDMSDSQLLPGSSVELHSRPLGVVGAIIPWNGPFLLSFLAANGILAAGNRLMLKPSEIAPKSAALLSELFGAYFDPTEVTVIEGDDQVSASFASLPFDHLLFTGSTNIGRKVMRAAAENLTPVTLELGGKCPVIVGKSAIEGMLAQRMAYGKLMFGGQVCVTPDYMLVPRGRAADIGQKIVEAARNQFPNATSNNQYTAIINDNHFARLSALVEDARAKGGKILQAQDLNAQSNSRRFPLHVVLEPSSDMLVMQEEIFGPVLPIMEMDTIDDALSYVSAHAHPLSAYYFGEDEAEQSHVATGLQTGSVVVNDVMCQIFHEQLPFGGVGTSGFGQYRGHAGFKRFSNIYPVLVQPSDDELLSRQRAPYGQGMDEFLDSTIAGLRTAFGARQ